MSEGKIISRRNFLKGSAGVVGAGALAVGFGAGSLMKPGTAHAALGYLPVATLNVDLVRKLAWGHYANSGG